MQILGTLPDGGEATAYAASSNGSVIVGWGRASNGNECAFRWTETTGMQALDGLNSSYALDVSDDGLEVAGYAGSPDGMRAFRWTTTGGMQNLGVLPGDSFSIGYGISGDGQTVVGTSGGRAFLWTPSLGMVDLNAHLLSLGAELTGWTLEAADGVNADGSVIVGFGSLNGEMRAFLAEIADGHSCLGDFTGDGIVGLDDLARLLSNFGQTEMVYDDGDVNEDGVVDLGDLAAVLSRFGSVCP
ncbi:MAG: hypothetical protein AMXMBFR47_42070 [Planctomycetota bacterium]